MTLSPDGQYVVDVYSTPTAPPISVLRNINGEVALELERADVSRLAATGWKPSTPIVVKANKDSDLIILPQQHHGMGADSNCVMRRRWDVFVRHLLGAEPPLEYRIGEPRSER